MDDSDPATAASLDDLAACLRYVHLLADKPTFRALEQQTTHVNGLLPGTRLKRARLTRTVVSDVLLGRKFPGKAFLLTFVDACGVDLENDRRWEQAWDRLAVQHDRQPAEAAFERLRGQLEDLRGQLAGAEHRADEAQADAERLRAELQVQAAEHRAALERARTEAARAIKTAYGQPDGLSSQLAGTRKTISAAVEWALHGKPLGRADTRVVACSDGRLSRENFTDIISRFDPGTPAELPQVSVNYVSFGPTQDHNYYLGMAIHKWAASMQTDGGELPERDGDNHPVTVTAYFCVPFQPLAEAAVSYQAMYQEFDGIRLSMSGGPPLAVDFPSRNELSAIDDLAMQSASRLLTGRPVCVLGAESATITERLAFIDAVMSMLPYGFRTRFTAVTWVRHTHRHHRFRLFFSDANRRADSPDALVYWGHPERTALTPGDDYAYTYGRWLAETPGQMETLAQLTVPRSFIRPGDVAKSLDAIGLPFSKSYGRRTDAGTPMTRFQKVAAALQRDTEENPPAVPADTSTEAWPSPTPPSRDYWADSENDLISAPRVLEPRPAGSPKEDERADRVSSGRTSDQGNPPPMTRFQKVAAALPGDTEENPPAVPADTSTEAWPSPTPLSRDY